MRNGHPSPDRGLSAADVYDWPKIFQGAQWFHVTGITPAISQLAAGATIRTPMVPAPKLSALTGAEVYVKYETMQVTSSFKDRGASVKLTDLAADPACKGVIAMSAGNHAQAVAYHAKRVGLPATMAGNEHIWHLYVIEVERRAEVLAGLHERGIGAGIHYPVPIHLHGAYAHLGLGEGSFPVAERAAKRILSLPLFPEITPEQQREVVAALKGALQG